MISLPVADINAIDDLLMPRKERIAVDTLLASYPRVVPAHLLVEAMYEMVGEKDAESNVVHSHLSKLRGKLRSIGFTILNEKFLGYRLVRIEVEADRRARRRR